MDSGRHEGHLQAHARLNVRTTIGFVLGLITVAVSIAAQAPQQAPRWPDGRVRLGAPSGRSGYWASPSARTLTELNAKNEVAPFLQWSRAVFLYRQQTKFKDDPLNRCLPPGGPRQFQQPQGVQFVEQREVGRILVLLGGGNRNWRVINTDGRPPGASAEAVPSYYGSSVGTWDGDTLVVDSVGYNERFWMGSNGVPHTEALHLTERFRRPDFGTLSYQVTIDDPRTYTRPWTAGWSLRWVDGDVPEYFCEGDKP